MARSWTDEEIFAFCDGEADGQTALAILIEERRDPDLAERIRKVRENDALLKAAMDAELQEPTVPLPPTSAARRSLVSVPPMAIAASVVVAMALGVFAGQWRAGDAAGERAAQEAALAGQLHGILENRLSGEAAEIAASDGFTARVTPVRTYRSESGHWCRDFDEAISRDGGSETRHGVACRIDGEWRRIRTVIDGEISGRV